MWWVGLDRQREPVQLSGPRCPKGADSLPPQPDGRGGGRESGHRRWTNAVIVSTEDNPGLASRAEAVAVSADMKWVIALALLITSAVPTSAQQSTDFSISNISVEGFRECQEISRLLSEITNSGLPMSEMGWAEFGDCNMLVENKRQEYLSGLRVIQFHWCTLRPCR
jgi:hypothetical protein